MLNFENKFKKGLYIIKRVVYLYQLKTQTLKIDMTTFLLAISIFLYIIGFILFSGMYCGMEFNKSKYLFICIFYPITIWFVK